jgi:16S rRNA (cytosine967-C5)-methyltransferase
VVKSSARGVALAALKRWRKKTEFADAIISRLLSDSALESADRAFAFELFYGVLRNLTLLDFWIAMLRSARVDVNLRDILQLGLYQLLIAKTSEHAAVYETVALASKNRRPIVNAILRSAGRRRRQLQRSRNSQSLEVRFSHPKFLIERWRRQFGEESTKALCDWNNRPPPIYARINQLKIDRPTFLERYPAARPVSDISNFVELASPTEALNRGDCYVQDPSTALACELLKPNSGDAILDACAAPGGKSGYLAELMENNGSLVTCDRDPARLRTLQENLTRLGVRITKIVCHDWTKGRITDEIRGEAPFDRILLDAPCSNTGVMRRRVDVRWRLKPSDFAQMQGRQIEIARAVLPLLKSDGILVYSTCSLEQDENDEVGQHLLAAIPTLRLEDERRCFPFRKNFDGAYASRFRQTA